MNRDSLLIVGTLGGGGIHRYVEEQQRILDGSIDASVYDMVSNPKGDGVGWVVTSVLSSVVAALKFPFRSPPDVVHVHTSHWFSFYRSSFYVLFAAYIWHRPVVLHVHGSSFDEFITTDSWIVIRLQSLVFGASDRIIVLSPYWRDVLSTRIPEPERKLRVLPNAIDPDDYSPTFEKQPPHVVFVSNLVERKGVDELVVAIEHLLQNVSTDVHVSIAGTGPLRPAIETLADRYDTVEYLGYISERDKRTVLDSGSVFVLPTHAEGLPIAILEGMAGGNAIVSTTVGSIPEVIDENSGILVSPNDTEQLTKALTTLVSSPELSERMGRHNRQLACDSYSWTTAKESLCEIYTELPNE